VKRVILLLIVLTLVHCYPVTSSAQDKPLKVVATTTIVADVVKNVGGGRVEVASLVPADADTHAFEPAPQDAAKVAGADVVLAVGAGYEAFLGGLMENAAQVELVTVSNGVAIYPFTSDEHADEKAVSKPLGVLGKDAICGDEQHDEATTEAEKAHEDKHAGGCDPHVWTDPRNVLTWADNIAAAFAKKDPANAATYQANVEAYKKQLNALDVEVRNILAAVPAEKRILVTNHEFMNYFARAYDFRVVGVVIPGGSTEGEPDPQQLAALIKRIVALKAPAIFAEASANRRLIDTVARDTNTRVVTTLSEALTAPGGAADTYLDYVRYNAQTIADALAGKAS
jgi:zinc/manganese transport system substrate-binding protein/manganese/iron transport system substrate-binding protein